MSKGAAVCVVDTNVVLVANKLSNDASVECVLTCVRRLRDICTGGHIVVDDLMQIFNEYRNKTLKKKGQREAGDEFVLWMISNLWNPARCTQVKLHPKQNDKLDFDEFPQHTDLKTFDRSDRVFVAVANAHPEHPHLLAACDTDYWHHRNALAACGVTVDFLCEGDVRRLANQKGI